jgi:hypothetical protein
VAGDGDMPGLWPGPGLRCAVLAFAAILAGCAGGTSRVADDLNSASLTQSKKAVALIKLGAADPMCTTLAAVIGVREGGNFRSVQFARIVRKPGEAAVAELELGAGEYHVVSYSCAKRGGAAMLAEPLGNGLFGKSYASFSLAAGEVLNVGYLQLVPMGSAQVAHNYRVVQVRLAVTDWPLAELDRFKQQRPNLYAQMKTRLMKVHRVEPPTMQQVRAACEAMRRLQSEGKLQDLPLICAPGNQRGPQRGPTAPAKKSIGI